MTRIKQIYEASQEYQDSMDEFQRYHTYPKGAFIDGAKWADENAQFSKEKLIEKTISYFTPILKTYCSEECVKELIDGFINSLEE